MWLPLLAAVTLFVSAGTLDWWPGRLCLRCVGLSWLATVAFLATVHPGLLRRRLWSNRTGPQPPAWDGHLLRLLRLGLLALLATAGIQSGRSGTALNPAIFAPGLLLLIAGTLVLWCSLRINPFFETEVRHQPEEDQSVISTGAYGWVRHPGYLALSLMLTSLPWMLHSTAAVAPLLWCLAMLVARLRCEESYLVEHLAGYREYQQQVRYRLIPWVW